MQLTLSVPFLGCSPRPRNKPGGSARKFPAFSLRPSTTAWRYGFSSSSFASLILVVSFWPRDTRSQSHAFFSSLVIVFFFSRSLSKCSYIGLKSHFSNDVILPPSFCPSAQRSEFYWSFPATDSLVETRPASP